MSSYGSLSGDMTLAYCGGRGFVALHMQHSTVFLL